MAIFVVFLFLQTALIQGVMSTDGQKLTKELGPY